VLLALCERAIQKNSGAKKYKTHAKGVRAIPIANRYATAIMLKNLLIVLEHFEYLPICP
jgi:hypothetical protein